MNSPERMHLRNVRLVAADFGRYIEAYSFWYPKEKREFLQGREPLHEFGMIENPLVFGSYEVLIASFMRSEEADVLSFPRDGIWHRWFPREIDESNIGAIAELARNDSQDVGPRQGALEVQFRKRKYKGPHLGVWFASLDERMVSFHMALNATHLDYFAENSYPHSGGDSGSICAILNPGYQIN